MTGSIRQRCSLSSAARAAAAALIVASLVSGAHDHPVRASVNGIVISQVYGGGGNSGATLKNDFIELFNASAVPIDVTGSSVQYASASGSSWQVTALSGTVDPGRYFLIQEAAGAGGTTNLPIPDAAGGIAMSATAGKVALVSGTTPLFGSGCPFGPSVVDFVGYGTGPSGANCFEGAGAAPTLSNTTAALRKSAGAQDTDSNSADFDSGAPNPRNSGKPKGQGAASPKSVLAGEQTLMTVAVTPGTAPVSTGIAVTGNLTSIGGASPQMFFDDATNGDATSGDNVFSFFATVAAGTPFGTKSIPFTVSDAQGRNSSGTVNLTVRPPNSLLFQDWTDTNLILADDDWTGVPGIVGYRGDGLTSGTDPQTVVADGTSTPVDVIANQSGPNALTTGGVAEFDGILNPTVALQGSGTAKAPFLLISVSTLGKQLIQVSYTVRDVDGSADNAVQPVALQYRVGNSGSFINLPGGFVADTTEGGTATKVTPVSVMLPANAENQPLLQVRIITADASGSDEWVGIDDILIENITTPTNPTVAATAVPSSVPAGDLTLVSAAVTPGHNPTSTSFVVTADLSMLGGAATQTLFDNGTNGDAVANDNTFSFEATVALGTTTGVKTVTVNVVDGENRPASTSIPVTVTPPIVTTPIHEIQGSASQSPIAGQAVTTTGIVTAVKSNGFYIQTPGGQTDNDPQTSDGLFVFTGGAPPAAAAVGSSVRVAGTVSEFSPFADPGSPPLTELTGPTVVLLATNQALPVPQVVMAADINETTGPEPLERFESMRVLIDSLTVVAPTDGFVNPLNATATSNGVFFGVLTGVPRPLREAGLELAAAAPPEAVSPATIPRFDGNPERIRVDTRPFGEDRLNVAAGATVQNLVGVLEYGFRTYTVLPAAGSPPIVIDHVSATPVPVATFDQFTVASFNMQRFFDTIDNPGVDDGGETPTPSAFGNRLNKASLAIRNVVRMPDIVGVEEVENLATLEAVADRVNQDAILAGQLTPNYQAVLVEGNDVGGIDVGFLLGSRVEVVDVTQVGKTETFLPPGAATPSLLNDRPPLVLRAIIHAQGHPTYPVTVIVNHLRSLRDIDDPADGLRVRTKRRLQAEFLANLIQSHQAAGERVVSIGDYNAFLLNDGYGDLIGTIKGEPTPAANVAQASADLVEPNLIDLADLAPAGERYSFVFDGNAQELDHIIVTQNVSGFIAYGRSNADFPEVHRNDPNRPERISDHDMVVGYIALVPDTTPPTLSLPGDITIEATGPITAVSYAVTAIDDVDGTNVTIECFPESGSAFAVGSTPVTCTATDHQGNESLPQSFNVVVTDTTAPAIQSTTPTPASLWPPHEKMVQVAIGVTATDAADRAPACRITSVTGNDGATPADWRITGQTTLELRADRTGGGSGRVYLIAIACTDASGNSTAAATAVTVPHDQRK